MSDIYCPSSLNMQLGVNNNFNGDFYNDKVKEVPVAWLNRLIPLTDRMKSMHWKQVFTRVFLLDDHGVFRPFEIERVLAGEMSLFKQLSGLPYNVGEILHQFTSMPLVHINHFATMGLYLKALYGQQKLVDVLVHIEDKIFAAHRIALACHSLYFARAFLLNKHSQNKLAEIRLKNINKDSFCTVLRFIYTGNLYINDRNVGDVVNTANELQISAVLFRCLDYLGYMPLNRAIDLVGEPEPETIIDQAKTLLNAHLADVMYSSNFFHMGIEAVELALGSDEVLVDREMDVFNAAMAWLSYDLTTRRKYLDRLMAQVRFVCMPPWEVIETSQVNRLIRSSPYCRNRVMEAIWLITLKDYRTVDMLNCSQPAPRDCLLQKRWVASHSETSEDLPEEEDAVPDQATSEQSLRPGSSQSLPGMETNDLNSKTSIAKSVKQSSSGWANSDVNIEHPVDEVAVEHMQQPEGIAVSDKVNSLVQPAIYITRPSFSNVGSSTRASLVASEPVLPANASVSLSQNSASAPPSLSKQFQFPSEIFSTNGADKSATPVKRKKSAITGTPSTTKSIFSKSILRDPSKKDLRQRSVLSFRSDTHTGDVSSESTSSLPVASKQSVHSANPTFVRSAAAGPSETQFTSNNLFSDDRQTSTRSLNALSQGPQSVPSASLTSVRSAAVGPSESHFTSKHLLSTARQTSTRSLCALPQGPHSVPSATLTSVKSAAVGPSESRFTSKHLLSNARQTSTRSLSEMYQGPQSVPSASLISVRSAAVGPSESHFTSKHLLSNARQTSTRGLIGPEAVPSASLTSVRSAAVGPSESQFIPKHLFNARQTSTRGLSGMYQGPEAVPSASLTSVRSAAVGPSESQFIPKHLFNARQTSTRGLSGIYQGPEAVPSASLTSIRSTAIDPSESHFTSKHLLSNARQTSTRGLIGPEALPSVSLTSFRSAAVGPSESQFIPKHLSDARQTSTRGLNGMYQGPETVPSVSLTSVRSAAVGPSESQFSSKHLSKATKARQTSTRGLSGPETVPFASLTSVRSAAIGPSESQFIPKHLFNARQTSTRGLSGMYQKPEAVPSANLTSVRSAAIGLSESQFIPKHLSNARQTSTRGLSEMYQRPEAVPSASLTSIRSATVGPSESQFTSKHHLSDARQKSAKSLSAISEVSQSSVRAPSSQYMYSDETKRRPGMKSEVNVANQARSTVNLKQAKSLPYSARFHKFEHSGPPLPRTVSKKLPVENSVSSRKSQSMVSRASSSQLLQPLPQSPPSPFRQTPVSPPAPVRQPSVVQPAPGRQLPAAQPVPGRHPPAAQPVGLPVGQPSVVQPTPVRQQPVASELGEQVPFFKFFNTQFAAEDVEGRVVGVEVEFQRSRLGAAGDNMQRAQSGDGAHAHNQSATVVSSRDCCNGPNILAVGGYIDGDDVAGSTRTQKLDSSCKEWEELPDMPEARLNFAAAFFKGKLFVLGGYDPSHSQTEGVATTDTFCFDVHKQRWKRGKCMRQARSFLTVCVARDCLYAVGGQGPHEEVLRSVEVYEAESKEWRAVDSMTVCRVGACSVHALGHVIVAGGYGDNSHCVDQPCPVLVSTERLYPATHRWQAAGDLRIPRAQASMVSVGGTLYLCGGVTRNLCTGLLTSVRDVDRYNPDTGQWTHLTDLQVARHNAGAAVIGHEIYVVGGVSTDLNQSLQSVECYNTQTGRWDTGLPDLRVGAKCVACVLTSSV